MRESRFRFLSLFLCCIATSVVTLPLCLHPFSSVPSGISVAPNLPKGDMAFFIFALWWDGYAVFNQGVHPWFCEWMGAPEGISLLYSTIVPLYGILAYPLQEMIGAIGVYNLWYFIGIVLLPFFGILVVRELGGNRVGALVTAAILLYCPLVAAHRSHLNILSVWWVVFVFWCYLRAWRTRRWIWFVIFGLAAGGVFYVSAYHTIHAGILVVIDVVRRIWTGRCDLPKGLRYGLAGAFFGSLVFGTVLLSVYERAGSTVLIAVVVATSVVGLLLMRERRGLRKILVGLTVSCFVAGMLMLPFFFVAVMDPRQEKATVAMSVMSKAFWSAQPLLYVMPPGLIDYLTQRGFLGGQDLLKLDGKGEFSVFPGFTVWLVLGFAAWRMRKQRNGWYWLGYAVVFAVLSFGPFARWGKEIGMESASEGLIGLPSRVFDHLPFLDGYRVFVRMAFGVHIALAVFIGMAWPKVKGWRGAVITGIVAGVIILEHVKPPTAVAPIRMPEVYQAISNSKRTMTIVEFPAVGGIYLYPLTQHRHRLVNQYVSRSQTDRKDKEQENLFLWFLRIFDHSLPHQVPPPKGVTGPERLRTDFDDLGIDIAIVHYDEIAQEKQPIVYRVFEKELCLERVVSEKGVTVYRNPRRETKGMIDRTPRSNE